MDEPIYTTETALLANALTILRGTTADLLAVYVYFGQPNETPTFADFTTAPTGAEVTLVEAPDPLAEGDLIDVASFVGPGLDEGAVQVPAGDVAVAVAGDMQRYVAIRTASEWRIFSVDVVTFL